MSRMDVLTKHVLERLLVQDENENWYFVLPHSGEKVDIEGSHQIR